MLRFRSHLILLFCSLAVGVSLKAQPADYVMEIPKTAADCNGAIKIVDGIGPLKNLVGYGNYQEVSNNSQEYPFLMPHEFNPCWFRFNAEEDGLLDIIIKSVNPSENYNFALYNSPGPWFCKSFSSEFISTPVRASCSAGDQGKTGISTEGQDTLANIDISNPFCSSLKVTKGEAFYLLVDSDFRPQGGYTIEIKVRQAPNE